MVLLLDTAKVHFKRSVRDDFLLQLDRDGYSITLEQQPSNKPELNVLDLRFFHLLQTKANRIKAGGKLKDIALNVTKTLKGYPPSNIEVVW